MTSDMWQSVLRSASAEPTPERAGSASGPRWRPGRGVLALPMLLVVIGLMLTNFGVRALERQEMREARLRFDLLGKRVSALVSRRLSLFSYGLKGARGLFEASKSVERGEFRAYIESRDMANEFPGGLGMGFIEWVPRASLAAFVDATRADGAPDFAVDSSGDRSKLMLVKYFENHCAMDRMLGRDVGADSRWLDAAESAIRAGDVAASEPIDLPTQGGFVRGCVCLLPVYRNGAKPKTAEEREAACVGWVFMPAVVADVLAEVGAIADGLVDVEVFDGAARSENLLYDADSHLGSVVGAVTGAAFSGRTFHDEHPFEFGGRPWTLMTSTTPAFDATIDTSAARWVGLGGAVASVLIGLLAWSLGRTTRRAAALAEEMTTDLRSQTAELRRLAMVVRRTKNAAIVTDVDRKIAWVNEGFTSLTGYTLDEVKGKSPGSFLQFEKTDKATVKRMSESLRRGEGCRAELLNRSKDGREYWLDVDIQPLHDASGALDGFMAVEADITTLVEHRNRLASMFAAMAEGVVVQEVGGRIIDANPAAERILGLTRDQMMGRTSMDPRWQAFDESGAELSGDRHPISVTLRTGESVRGFVMGIHTPNGAKHWISVSTEPVRGADGAITSAVASFTDITARRRDEERLDLTIKGAGLGAWDWNVKTGEVVFNEQWARMLGYAPGEIEPHVRSWEGLVHPADMPIATAALIDHFEQRTADYRCEHRLRRKDGSWCWVADAGRVIERAPDGSPVRMLGIHFDISQAKELEFALVEALEQARAATQAKSEFLANMSHEIRTPMTAIMGYTDLLYEDGDLGKAPKQRLEYINTIRRNGEHLLSIINDILDLAKIEAGKMIVETIAASPAQIVEDVVSLMRVRSQGKGITLDVVFETDVPETIQTDPTRLKQVLLNLVGNAIKFTELGGVTLRIGLDQSTPGAAFMRFQVEDTGIGMTPEQTERMFGAFEQADAGTTRKFGGTGLGLKISKRLAEMMGGFITVSSQLGKGSVFTAVVGVGSLEGVPMIQHEKAGHVVSRPPAPKGVDTQLKGLRILLAEDGPDNQRLISFHLRRAGAEVKVVENGRLAVEALTADGTLDGPLTDPPGFDLLLTDMQMPELDGYGAARMLRAKGCTMPIVALTAHAMAGDAEKCIGAGCDAYASKPIDKDTLLATCRGAVEARGAKAPG
jgi:PAS domain S-box-containing protein